MKSKTRERPTRKISTSITLGLSDKEKAEKIADAWDITLSEALRRLIHQFDLDSLN
jgi:hypothetical protein